MGEEARRGEQPHQTLLAEILLAPLAHTAQEAEVAVAVPLVAELLYVESERASHSLLRSYCVAEGKHYQPGSARVALPARVAQGIAQGPPAARVR